MFDWILNTPPELHEKNKEKQAFLLIYANTFVLLHNHFLYCGNTKCKRKPIARCEICLNSITKTP